MQAIAKRGPALGAARSGPALGSPGLAVAAAAPAAGTTATACGARRDGTHEAAHAARPAGREPAAARPPLLFFGWDLGSTQAPRAQTPAGRAARPLPGGVVHGALNAPPALGAAASPGTAGAAPEDCACAE
jgi:hypothetical protein